jgi:hypothetical protein
VLLLALLLVRGLLLENMIAVKYGAVTESDISCMVLSAMVLSWSNRRIGRPENSNSDSNMLFLTSLQIERFIYE